MYRNVTVYFVLGWMLTGCLPPKGGPGVPAAQGTPTGVSTDGGTSLPSQSSDENINTAKNEGSSNNSNSGTSSNNNESSSGSTASNQSTDNSELLFAHFSAGGLQDFYSVSSGVWEHPWWNSANSANALLDYMRLSGSKEYLSALDNVFEKNKAANFITDKLDDNAMWGIAWLKAYDLTKNSKYLDVAKLIANDLNTAGWDTVCSGGIYQMRDKSTGKGAVENELFIALTAGLHNRISGDTNYLNLAVKGWNWLLKSGLINSKNLVNEALGPDCKNDGGPTWSFNQGIILGAAAELYQAKKDNAYLTKAKDIASASMKDLATAAGIVREKNESSCGDCLGDERISKGIYVRFLRDFAIATDDSAISSFLKNNAQTAWSKGRGAKDLVGFHWDGPFDTSDASRQTAALDLFNATLDRKLPTNLAQGKSATTSGDCKTTEGGATALDENASTKWCGKPTTEGSWIEIDLGATKSLQRVRILHAAAGGETSDWNTKAFEISLSNTAGGPWTEAVKVENNTAATTIHNLQGKSARFVRIHVSHGGTDNVTRIYEIAVE